MRHSGTVIRLAWTSGKPAASVIGRNSDRLYMDSLKDSPSTLPHTASFVFVTRPKPFQSHLRTVTHPGIMSATAPGTETAYGTVTTSGTVMPPETATANELVANPNATETATATTLIIAVIAVIAVTGTAIGPAALAAIADDTVTRGTPA